MTNSENVPSDSPEWHPDLRPDVSVRIRTAAHGSGASAVLTADPPMVPRLEGRRVDHHEWRPTKLALAFLWKWVEALPEPSCIVVDIDDDLAIAIATMQETGPHELRGVRLRLWGALTLGHDVRRPGQPRPVATGDFTAHVEDEGCFILENAKKGDA